MLLSVKDFKDIAKTLQNHLNSKPLVMAKRFRFHNRNQKETESMTEYMADMCRLSKHCKFTVGCTTRCTRGQKSVQTAALRHTQASPYRDASYTRCTGYDL